MSFIKNAKIALAAAALSLVGSVASAATITVAEISVGGTYMLAENAGGGDALGIAGGFSLTVDPDFDPFETNDFILEASLSATGLPDFSETARLDGVTGFDVLDTIGFALSSLISPVLITDVLDEIFDGDLAPTAIAPGLFFAFDFTSLFPLGDTISGTFVGSLSEGPFAPVAIDKFGTFAADAKISVVPLPASGFLLIGALAGVGALRRRKTS